MYKLIFQLFVKMHRIYNSITLTPYVRAAINMSTDSESVIKKYVKQLKHLKYEQRLRVIDTETDKTVKTF